VAPAGEDRRTCDETGPEIQIVEAMRHLLVANRAAREAMLMCDELLEGGIERIIAGERIADVVRSTPAGSQRQATQDSLERVNLARQDLRLRVIAACLDQGMLPGQIAEAWGVSRQRIDHYVQRIKRASRI
jgi:hypothetical protein